MTDKPLTLESFKEALAELKESEIAIKPTHIIVDPSWIEQTMSRTFTPIIVDVFESNHPLHIPIFDGEVIKHEIVIGPKPLVIDYDGKRLIIGEMNDRFAKKMRRLKSRRKRWWRR